MKRFVFAGLSALALNFALAPVASASEAANKESIPGENTTIFDPRDLASTDISGEISALPPSGDSNPSDRSNPTVDGRDIIDPQAN